MTTTLATLQHLRSNILGNFPLDLAPGPIAFNIAEGNFDSAKENYNIFVFVGNGSNTRVDEAGTVLMTSGTPGHG